MADAAQLCAFLAQKWLIEEGNLRMGPAGLSLLMQARMHLPPAPIPSIDGVDMMVLTTMEKLKQIGKNASTFSGAAPYSPFSRRGPQVTRPESFRYRTYK